ncbi:BING4CT-domain-containing protein [Clavulina sp. PMI_390]|nr:BING4CT-domain-containing protein [Clavulina sp. PMI_390]
MESLIATANRVAPLKRKRGARDSGGSKFGGTSSSGALSSLKKAGETSSTGSKSKSQKNGSREKKEQDDPTLHSVSTSIRSSAAGPASKSASNRHIKDLKLRAHLNSLDSHAKESRALAKDTSDLLLNVTAADAGFIAAEDVMERTWRVGQEEIVKNVGVASASQRREWVLDGGPYRSRYTRNGRHLAIAGKHGHVASFDWQAGKMHFELQLRENIRDITYLHNQAQVAVAQKQHVFIYDQDGVELHRLNAHVDVNRLEFLPYHWLLVSVGNAGYLKYTDTSTGAMVAEQRTKLGACRAMAQNMHNAVIYLGHQNGTVTLHTPNLPTPPVTLLSHMGPVSSISVDPSTGGRYMATAGVDGRVKVWDCRNWKGCVREWVPRSQGGGAGMGRTGTTYTGIEVDWSQKGILGVASGGSVYMYTPPTIRDEHRGMPPVYMTHPVPSRPLTSLRFCPYTDVLTIGHTKGLSSILVPGAGEPQFDSAEADPFENTKGRQEREVRALLDKIQPDLITLSDEFAGRLASQTSALEPAFAEDDEDNVPSASSSKKEKVKEKIVPSYSTLSRLDRLKVSGKADLAEQAPDPSDDGESASSDDDDEPRSNQPVIEVNRRIEKEKKAGTVKQRGKNSSLKRYLRKKRKNVIDSSSVAMRQKVEAQKEKRRKEMESGGVGSQNGQDDSSSGGRRSALDRFRKNA